MPPELHLSAVGTTLEERSVTAKPGSTITLVRSNETPPVKVQYLASNDIMVSRKHFEILFAGGAWRLFDRGTDGDGSKKATMVRRGHDVIVLKGGFTVASNDSLFDVKTFADLHSQLDGMQLGRGVALESGDEIAVRPQDSNSNGPLSEEFDVTTAKPRGKELFLVSLTPPTLVPGT